jgi:hypothetical protein
MVESTYGHVLPKHLMRAALRAAVVTVHENYRRTNLCSYFWHFMFGVVLCAFIACASALAAYFLLMGPVFWIVLCITDWHLYRMEVDAFAGFLFWGLAALGIGFAFYASWREAGRRTVPADPSAGARGISRMEREVLPHRGNR